MDLDLNCANIFDNGKGISIPPKNAKKYPTKIGVKALKEYIQKGGDILVIPVAENKEQTRTEKVNNDEGK